MNDYFGLWLRLFKEFVLSRELGWMFWIVVPLPLCRNQCSIDEWAVLHSRTNLFKTLWVCTQHPTGKECDREDRRRGFQQRCVRGELIAQRSRTVHELGDGELLGLQIRGSTGGCADTYTSAGWLHFGCSTAGCMQVRLFDGMWGLLA